MSAQKPEKPKGVISVEEAKELNDNLTRQKKESRGGTRITELDDNRSCWWSLEDLEKYIAYAKYESKENGYTMNGLRIYMGAYGPEKNGETTLFMVPTSEKKDNFTENNEENGGENPPQDPPNIPGMSPLNGGVGGDPPGNPYP